MYILNEYTRFENRHTTTIYIFHLHIKIEDHLKAMNTFQYTSLHYIPYLQLASLLYTYIYTVTYLLHIFVSTTVNMVKNIKAEFTSILRILCICHTIDR